MVDYPLDRFSSRYYEMSDNDLTISEGSPQITAPTAPKGRTFPRKAPQEALDAAESAAKRVYDREAPVRRCFIERLSEPGVQTPTPPLATMMRGGRGGEVRLKVYLSTLWMASGFPHDVKYPARAWASLLGLDDPDRNGARRVSDAVAWLGAHQLVRVEPRKGRPPTVTLLDESGDGSDYQIPGEAFADLEEKYKGRVIPPELQWRQRYVRLAPSFWTQGWAAVLSGPAIAMFLVLSTNWNQQNPNARLWISPSQATERFSISEDTRTKGLRELCHYGIATMKRQSISRDAFDFRRMRNTYVLHPKRLDHPITAPLWIPVSLDGSIPPDGALPTS